MPRPASLIKAPKGRNSIAESNPLGSPANNAASPQGTEQGELPEGWRLVRFLNTIYGGKVRIAKIRRSDYREIGRYPIIDQGQQQIAGYWDNEDDLYRGELPVIVFGDHTRAFKFVEFPFVVGADGTHVLVPNKECFDPFFLYLALTFLDIPGRGYNRHFGLLKECFVVSPPLPEQREIAEVLRTVQRAKEATEKVIAATRQLKASLMKHLFTYGPLPDDQADKVPLNETGIGGIPDHWEVKTLGSVASIERGKFAHRPRNDPQFYGGDIPFIQTGDVARSGGRIFSYSQTLNERGLSVSRVFPRATIVLTIAANIGDVGILEFDSAFPDSLVGIKPRENTVDSEFLCRFLETQKGEMDRLAPRGTQKNINIRFLEPWPTPVPPPYRAAPNRRAVGGGRCEAGGGGETASGAGGPVPVAAPSPHDRQAPGERHRGAP